MTEPKRFSLHKATFNGDITVLEELIKNINNDKINEKDPHGNTPLHIASMKGEEECVRLLIENGAKTAIDNDQWWTPIHEAVSYGDREMLKNIWKGYANELKNTLSKQSMVKMLNADDKNFKMILKIRFRSAFHPLIAEQLPSGKLTITKKQQKLRIDTERIPMFCTSLSLIFDGTVPDDRPSSTLLCHENHFFYVFDSNVFGELINMENHIDADVHKLMTNENSTHRIEKDSNAEVILKKRGNKKVGQYSVEIYESRGLIWHKKKRTEHLLDRDLTDDDDDGSALRRALAQYFHPSNVPDPLDSLPPPPENQISWKDYIDSSPGKFPCFSREIIQTDVFKQCNLVIGITKDIELDFDWIINIISSVPGMDSIHGIENIEGLKKFVKKLPKGFPVLLEMPMGTVLPTIYLNVKCVLFQINPIIHDSTFTVPPNYTNAH